MHHSSGLAPSATQRLGPLLDRGPLVHSSLCEQIVMGARWPVLPYAVIYFVGAAGAASIIFCALILSGSTFVESWWMVLLPVLLALGLIFILFTIAMVLWVVVAVRLCSGNVEVECEGDTFNLDMLFRTAKICFLGHGYTLMLCLAVGLLILKLETWPSCPIIYPLLPVVILGSLHVFLAIMLKSPELDAGRSSFIGVSMLGHAIMLTLKIDHFRKTASMPWALVFLPSWFTYAGVLMYAGSHLTLSVSQLFQPSTESTSGSSLEPPRARDMDKSKLQAVVRMQSIMLVGTAMWALGFAVSQVFLTLYLDQLAMSMRWEVMLLPALLGWVLMVVCCAPPIVEFFAGIVHTFQLQFDPNADREGNPNMPLLPGESRVPLPWH